MPKESPNNSLESVLRVRAGVEKMRQCLLTAGPAGVHESIPHLEMALATMRAVESELGSRLSRDTERRWLSLELGRLRRDLAMAARLIAGASRFYAGWAKLLESATAGYTAQGELTGPAARGSMVLDG